MKDGEGENNIHHKVEDHHAMSLAGNLLAYPSSEVLVAAEVWIRQEEQAVKRLGNEDRELAGGCRFGSQPDFSIPVATRGSCKCSGLEFRCAAAKCEMRPFCVENENLPMLSSVERHQSEHDL